MPSPPDPFRPRPRVALLVETSVAPGRQILRGIAQYQRENRPCSVYHQPGALVDIIPRFIQERWPSDAIIARLLNDDALSAVKASGLPAVDVLGIANDGSIPLVHVDDRAIALAAADHLIECGFRHFGYYGNVDTYFSQARKRAFIDRTSPHTSAPPAVLEVPLRRHGVGAWEALQSQLINWLRSLARPVGIMVATDARGHELLEACRRAEITVPEELAVISVDNDEPLCEVCNPP